MQPSVCNSEEVVSCEMPGSSKQTNSDKNMEHDSKTPVNPFQLCQNKACSFGPDSKNCKKYQDCTNETPTTICTYPKCHDLFICSNRFGSYLPHRKHFKFLRPFHPYSPEQFSKWKAIRETYNYT